MTDWALGHFREHYGDESIGKWDIFYYVYGVLHHPGYREKFADNLKRELPRIPLAPACEERPREGAGALLESSGTRANAKRQQAPDQSPERERGDRRTGALLESSGTRPTRGSAATSGTEPERDVGHGDPALRSADEPSAATRRPVRGPAATSGTEPERDVGHGDPALRSADEPSAATRRPVRGPAATHRQDAGATRSDGGGTESPAGSRCHKCRDSSGTEPGRYVGHTEVPAASGFWAFAEAGRRLAELHVGYESLEPWELEWVETPGEPLSYVVEKMRLSKDKKSLKVNDSLTLGGIPPEVFEYRLGNRSALEWVIDQYRVKEDQRSGIRSDPNNADDPQYIVRLVGRVVRVSVETVRIVKGLPEDYAPAAECDG